MTETMTKLPTFHKSHGVFFLMLLAAITGAVVLLKNFASPLLPNGPNDLVLQEVQSSANSSPTIRFRLYGDGRLVCSEPSTTTLTQAKLAPTKVSALASDVRNAGFKKLPAIIDDESGSSNNSEIVTLNLGDGAHQVTYVQGAKPAVFSEVEQLFQTTCLGASNKQPVTPDALPVPNHLKLDAPTTSQPPKQTNNQTTSPTNTQIARQTDTTSPSAPGMPKFTGIGSRGVTLSWTSSTDNEGVSRYIVLRNNEVIGYATTTNYRDETVVAGTVYSYALLATDGAGNNSNYSLAANVTIPFTADTVPPTAPNNLVVQAANSRQINVKWDAATDNMSVKGYDIYRDNVLIASGVNSTTFGDTGLMPNTAYSYYVRARDSAGNTSTGSPLATTITAPAAPTNLNVTQRSVGFGSHSSAINLAWQAVDNLNAGGFIIYRDNMRLSTISSSQPSFVDTGLSGNQTFSYYVVGYNAAGSLSGPSNTITVTTCYRFLGLFSRCNED